MQRIRLSLIHILEYLRNYLLIQRHRYDNFEVYYDVDAQALQMCIRDRFRKGRIQCTDGTILGQSTGGLRQAYLGAMEHCFHLHEIRLDERLFSNPVYNTWIELTLSLIHI